MADVQFEEEPQYQQSSQMEQKPFSIRLVLATGIVSTDTAAKYVLLGIVVLAVILTFILPLLIRGGSPTLTPMDQIRSLSAPGMSP